MTIPSLRRIVLGAALAASALLASCGGGNIVDPFIPARIVAFGDGFSDVGQTGARYTVNDGSVNVWAAQFSARYSLPLVAQSANGTSRATGNARIQEKPDAGGSTTTLTIREQIDAFLAAGPILPTDLVVINGGFSDIIAQTVNTSLTPAQRLANVRQAGIDLATQVRRVINAGATHVVLIGVYDLRITPWARSIGLGNEGSALSDLSLRFNEALQLPLVDLGRQLLYVDAANYFNLLFNQPRSFNFERSDLVACTATGSGDMGIGISATAHVSSRLCTPTNVQTAVALDYNRLVFADPVYPTPAAHRLFGDFAYDRVRSIF